MDFINEFHLSSSNSSKPATITKNVRFYKNGMVSTRKKVPLKENLKLVITFVLKQLVSPNKLLKKSP